MVPRENPAGRLYHILDQARRVDERKPKRQAWTEALGAGDSSASAVYHYLVLMQDELQETRRCLECIPNLNRELYLKWFPAIEKVLAPASISGNWQQDSRQITDAMLVSLAHCADKLAELHTEEPLENEELDALKRDTEALFKKVSEGSLDPQLRNVILDLLEAIRRAIVEYRIRGARALEDALRQTLGAIVINYPAFRASAEDVELKKFSALLCRLKAMVEKGLRIAALAKPAVDILMLVGKSLP